MVGEVDTNEMVSDFIYMSCSLHSISIQKCPTDNDSNNSFTSIIGGLLHTANKVVTSQANTQYLFYLNEYPNRKYPVQHGPV